MKLSRAPWSSRRDRERSEREADHAETGYVAGDVVAATANEVSVRRVPSWQRARMRRVAATANEVSVRRVVTVQTDAGIATVAATANEVSVRRMTMQSDVNQDGWSPRPRTK